MQTQLKQKFKTECSCSTSGAVLRHSRRKFAFNNARDVIAQWDKLYRYKRSGLN